MGYLREKYSRQYFLKQDAGGKATHIGVGGIEEFRAGSLRRADQDILGRIDLRGKHVLDIGCGRGEALKFAREHGAARVTGVDFSEHAIAIAGAFLGQYGIHAELCCQDALVFVRDYAAKVTEAQSEPFDVVLMLDCVEHIPRAELTELLTLLKRMLSKRAILGINTPHFGTDNDVLREGLKTLARDGSDDHEETKGMHCNRYTRGSLKRYMSAAGYIPISHHLFVPEWSGRSYLWATREARRKAFRLGYPLLLPQALASEAYTGYSWRTHPVMRPVRWLYLSLKHRGRSS
jgi:2-polyprenyl-3-methyl-5-hydroxy-6-metoxy-1,4-benzoquinol methylase